jgi:DNA-directed RNA polymerase specialized sigma24 family protein
LAIRACHVEPRLPSDLLTDTGLSLFLRRITAMLRRHSPDHVPECADEAAEDTAIAVRKNPGSFHSMAKVCAYAMTAANHGAQRARTIRSREIAFDGASENAADEYVLHVTREPEAVLLEKEKLTAQRNGLEWGLSKLSPTERVAVFLCDLHELTYDQASVVTGLAVRTLYNARSKALPKLRLILSKDLLTC